MALSRGEKKLFGICAFALAVPLGVAAFIGHINATPVIAVLPVTKAPQPNGYDLYVRASNMIKPANPPVDPNLEIKTITDPKIRAQRYSVKRKDAWLAQNKAGFALFEQAQKADSLAPPDGDKGKELRQMARYKVIESNAHWQRGDADLALQSGLDVAQLGHDIQHGGALMDFLVGAAINQMTIRATSDTVDLASAQTAKLGARRLEGLLAARRDLDAALAEDNARIRQVWLQFFQIPSWRADFVREQEWMGTTWWGKGIEPLTWKERGLIRVTSKRQIIADLDTVYQRVRLLARTPYVNTKKGELTVGNPFIDRTHTYLARSLFNQVRALTADRTLMLRLALRARQLECGAPPPNLQSLVPAYIRAVPLDPFGKGAPFRYRTDGVAYTLWSIGPDGRDNGGTPIPWHNKRAKGKRYADERERLPIIGQDDTKGDYVAGKNH